MKIPEINIKSALPKNIAINGNMDFWQRVAGNSLALSTSTATSWAADRYSHATSGATAKSFTVQRSTNVPAASLVGVSPQYSCQVTCNTSYSPAAADRYFAFRTVVEGVDMFEIIEYGMVTISFEFFATQAGSYPCRIYNFSSNRSYVKTFSYSVANVWERIVVTFPIENTAWATNTGPSLGFYIQHDGSTYQTAPNTWVAGDFGTTNAGGFVSLCQSGLTFRVTNFAIHAGDVSIDRKMFKTRGNGYADELALCQRYYQKSGNNPSSYWIPGVATNSGSDTRMLVRTTGSTDRASFSENLHVPLRGTAVLTFYPARPALANTAGNVSAYNGDQAHTFNQSGVNVGPTSIHGFIQAILPNSGNELYSCQYTADAEI